MPRIPAAIAIVILVATCIGFNTARFPVVLEMAAIPEMSSQTKIVVYSDSSAESSGFDDDSDISHSDSSDGYESSYSGRSGYSSDDECDSDGDSSYDTGNLYGSEEESNYSGRSGYSSADEYDSDSDSSYDTGNLYGSYDDDTLSSSEEDDWSGNDAGSHQYSYDHDESDSDYGSGSSGYGGDRSNYGDSSHDYGGNASYSSSPDDENSVSTKRNRRNKNRSKNSGSYGGMESRTASKKGSSKAKSAYAWGDSSDEDSGGPSSYDSHGSEDADSAGYDSHAQSDRYGDGYSSEDWGEESTNSYGDSRHDDGWGTSPNSYSNSHSHDYGSSYGDEADGIESDNEQDWSSGDSNGSDSPYNYDSVTRYDERQEAAVDNASTWSEGAPVTVSPTGPYAYGSSSYDDSAAASANVARQGGGLDLVPVTEDQSTNDKWGNGGYGSGYRSSDSSYSDRDSHFPQASAMPEGVRPLPPIDWSVRGPTLAPFSDGSVPLYPSTAAF